MEKKNKKKDTAVYPVVDTTEFITPQHSLYDSKYRFGSSVLT